MCSLRLVTATLVAGLTAASMAARPAGAVVSFLDAGSKTRGGDVEVAQEAIAALEATTRALTLSGVPLVSGQSANFVVEPANAHSAGPTFYLMKSDGTSRTLDLGPRRTWRGTDPMNPDRAIFIASDSEGRLRTTVMDEPGAPMTAIVPSRTGAYAVTSSQAAMTTGALAEAIELQMEDTTPPQTVTPRDPDEPRPLLSASLRLDISHALYISLGRSEERVLDYVTDMMGAANIIFRRDVKLHWDLMDVVIWEEPPPFEHPLEYYYEEFGTSEAALSQAAESLHEQYRLWGAAFPAAWKRGAHFFLWPMPMVASRVYIGTTFNPQFAYHLLIVRGHDGATADADTFFHDTLELCRGMGFVLGANHTSCYMPPIDCCRVFCNCSSATPQVGTIMSNCHLVDAGGAGVDMRFHPRVLSESIFPYIDNVLSSPMNGFGSYTAAPLMAVHGFKDTYISHGSGETTGATLRATPASGSVEQTFMIRNVGSAPLLLTGTPSVAIMGSERLTIVSQPDKSVLEEGESTSFTMSYDPADGPAYGHVSIPTNVAGVADYSFQVAGQILVPSEPVVNTYAPSLAIPDNIGYMTERLMEVTGVPGLITDIKVRFDGTNCGVPGQTGIQHTRVGDLQFALQSPEGTMVWLMVNPGHSTGDHFCNTILADDASAPSIQDITASGAPYTGTYRPANPLSAFHGEHPNGHWRVIIGDTITGTAGTLHSLSLIITGEETSSVTDWSVYE